MTSELVWYLTSSDGSRHRLPREMLFVGRQECELILKSHSVDKQHAVLNYDSVQDAFRIKDLGTLNGTFVNETRLPQQVYITMKDGDLIKFGYDTQTFTIAKLIRVVSNDNGSLLVKKKGTSSSTSLTSSTSTSSSSSSSSSSSPDTAPSKNQSKSSEANHSKPTYFEIPSQENTASGKGEELNIRTPTKQAGSPIPPSPRTPTSFTVDINDSDVIMNGTKNLQHYASMRKAKRKAAFAEKKKTSNSVDQWFNLNQPGQQDETFLKKKEDSIEAHGDGDSKRTSLRSSLNSTSAKKFYEPTPSLSPQKSKREIKSNVASTRSSLLGLNKPTIASSLKASASSREKEALRRSTRKSSRSEAEDESKSQGERASVQSSKKSTKTTTSSSSSSSSSDSSSSSSSDVSESGTYTVKNEKGKSKKESKDSPAMDALQKIGGATVDSSTLRSSWVNEWVNQHQITPVPVEQAGEEDRMSRSESEGQRVRRSLPTIPAEAVKAAQNAVQSSQAEEGNSTKDKTNSKTSEKTRRSDNEKENLPSEDLPNEQKSDDKSSPSMASFQVSHPELASTLQSLQEKFQPKTSVFEPPLVEMSSSRASIKESSGNTRPSRSRRPLTGRSSSGRKSSSKSKYSSSSSDSSSSSKDSSTEPSLVRSNSFTKPEPSGVVPPSELPDATVTYRLCRSSSFTKDSPGLPEALIPRISSESSSSSLELDRSIDTSLLMKDTEKVISALKKLPRKSVDDSSVVSMTNGEMGDRWTRPSPRRAMTDRLLAQKREEVATKPRVSRNPTVATKSSRRSLRQVEKLSSTGLSSDSECVRPVRRPVDSLSRSNNTCSDTESSLKLTRTTILRQNKARDTDKYRSKTTSSSTSVTASSSPVNQSPREKKKAAMSSMERLDRLSKPPARRLSRNSETESSDVEFRSKPIRRRATSAQQPQRSVRSSLSSASDVMMTQRSGTSLGGRIVRESRKSERLRRYDSLNDERHRVTNPRLFDYQNAVSSDCVSSSESEYDDAESFDPNNNAKMNGRAYTHNRSPPDGEMSDEIARLSHDLARDIGRLSSKPLEDSSTMTSSSTLTGQSCVSPSEADSLDRRAILIDSPPAPERRKTWNSGRTALDGLMLSNVCALSSRITALADCVVGKIAVMHGGSPPVDLSKSHVPLLQQTASQEMAAIVNNLRQVEMQLLRADEIIDPDHKLQDLIRD